MQDKKKDEKNSANTNEKDNKKSSYLSRKNIQLALSIVLCVCTLYFDFTQGFLASPTFIAFAALICSLLYFKNPSNKIFTSKITYLILSVLASLVFYYVIEYAGGSDLSYIIQNNIGALLLPVLLIALVCGVVYAITGRFHLTIIIVGGIVLIFSLISYYTLTLRGTPLVYGDIYGGDTALDVIGGYTFKLNRTTITSVLIVVGFMILAIPFDGKIKNKLSNATIRISILVVCLCIPYLTFSGTLFNELGYEPFYWDQSVSVKENGQLVNFLANYESTVTQAPTNYSVDSILEDISKYTSDSSKYEGLKPDIVLIMGESWSNLSENGYIETDKEVMPFIESLKDADNGIYNDLVVSSFGGGTSFSEYQVFTGTNSVYGLHPSPFVYSTTKDTPSLVSTLKELGYTATAMHTGTKDAWSRNEALPKLGFDTFITKDEMENDMVRYYTSDRAMYNETLKILDEAKSDQPQFIYNITIQTHGGYEAKDYENTITVEDVANSAETNQYLSLMNESDKQLEEFINTLKNRERPTIVIGYGDHLPAVENTVIEQYKDNWAKDSGLDKNLASFKTFYFMWSNYIDFEEMKDNAPSIMSLNYLNSYILKTANLPMTGYEKLLYEASKKIPVVSSVCIFDNENQLTELQNRDSIAESSIQDRIQYYLLHGNSNTELDTFFHLK
ncbi:MULTISPECIES: LTA synthase family protein [unclassified Breznakia]|uniref:LTA synthase family protein n=1 Tax=unclassified Breznakia TaxID=2623764 RepID=UPI002476572E|nr:MULTISPECIES: LTA synthase family protein [unclassified Breznakia]MDH6367835.1 phosphoglycerol transferase MdoB-like AlkP superfamily enzyme [Breznakia sp. PH1-1]MDH6404918.1 phosphoglycerol transferase MdoB-like AlkP superfamily enzyme [Breznakia sp. PF1-11]MDH6412638.1 phosphoglycerol transferase MdoB-like AlkP superfamily enzyme [Breznakia sp. PFB1-11]MDH6414993.1 phosphoglycerol transferase MdoB-like AlkP superfamily enzyme [Breznakia sp. PFB1-14]MDH6417304.1 phosphoglycerol transferase